MHQNCHPPTKDVAELARLNDRQREVLQLIAEGQNTKTIALVLHVSTKAVEYHRVKLMRALNIWDVAGLTRFAVRSGLIDVWQ